ncbi:MAG: hypothetical protein JO264_21230, partial [Acidisphaera sp.]|nr:hypothetical protein [Acidisphaera sp.]
MRSARHKTFLLLGLGAGIGYLIAARPDRPAPTPMQAAPHRTRRSWPVAAALACALVLGAGFAGWQAMQSAREDGIARSLTGGDPGPAASLVTRYGCGGCHTIPGLQGADGQVAPPLAGLRKRVYIGGVMRNTPENLIAWIVDPRSISPHSAMPV